MEIFFLMHFGRGSGTEEKINSDSPDDLSENDPVVIVSCPRPQQALIGHLLGSPAVFMAGTVLYLPLFVPLSAVP